MTAIAADTRVTVAVVTRDVLARAVAGTVGANCRPYPHPSLPAGKSAKFSEKCVLAKSGNGHDFAAVETGVYLHLPSSASFLEAFVPLPVARSADIAAAAAAVGNANESNGSTEVESLLALALSYRTSPSVAELSIRSLSYSPQSFATLELQSCTGQSLSALLQPFVPPAIRKIFKFLLF